MQKILDKGVEKFPHVQFDIDLIQKTSLKHLLTFKNEDRYYGIVISLITSLEEKDVENIFKMKGIYHSEFGEGFYDDNADEDEEYKQSREEQCYSLFVEIDNVIFHICIDHRGSSIEMENKTNSKEAFEKFCNIIVD